MKKILSILLILSLIPNFLLAGDQNEKEEKAVQRAIKNYYQNGLVRAEPKLLTKVLHEETEMIQFDKDGNAKKAGKQEFLALFDPNKADKSAKWNTEILDMDVLQNVASVEIKMENGKTSHIDYLNLIKEDGKWLIKSCVSQEL